MPHRRRVPNNRNRWPKKSAATLVAGALLFGANGRTLAVDSTASQGSKAPTSIVAAGATPASPRSSLRLVGSDSAPPVEGTTHAISAGQPSGGTDSWTMSNFVAPRQFEQKATSTVGTTIQFRARGADVLSGDGGASVQHVVVNQSTGHTRQHGHSTGGNSDLINALSDLYGDRGAAIGRASEALTTNPPIGVNLAPSSTTQAELAASQIDSLAKALEASGPQPSTHAAAAAPGNEQDPARERSTLMDIVSGLYSQQAEADSTIGRASHPLAAQADNLAKLLDKPAPAPQLGSTLVIMPGGQAGAANKGGDLMDRLAKMYRSDGTSNKPAASSNHTSAPLATSAAVPPTATRSPSVTDSTLDISGPLMSSVAEVLATKPAAEPAAREVQVAEDLPEPAPLVAAQPVAAPSPISTAGAPSLLERVERIVVPDRAPATPRAVAAAETPVSKRTELRIIAAGPIAPAPDAYSEPVFADNGAADADDPIAATAPLEPVPIESYNRRQESAYAGAPAKAASRDDQFATNNQVEPIQSESDDREPTPAEPAPMVTTDERQLAVGQPIALPGLPVESDAGQVVVVVVVPQGGASGMGVPAYGHPGRLASPSHSAYGVLDNGSGAGPSFNYSNLPYAVVAPPAGLYGDREMPTLLADSESPLKADGGWTVARPDVSSEQEPASLGPTFGQPQILNPLTAGPGFAVNNDPPPRLAMQPPQPVAEVPAVENSSEGQLPAPPAGDARAATEPGPLPGTVGETDSIAKAEKLGEEPVNNELQFLRSQTVLLQPGQSQCDIGLVYSHDQNDVPIVLLDAMGDISGVVEGQVRQRELFIPFAVRYGFTERIQLFADAPVGWSNTELSWPGSDDFDNDGGIGDITAGAAVMLRSDDCRDIVFTFGVTAPTGDDPFDATAVALPTATLGEGFWAFSGELLCIQTYDPVVLFTSLGTRQYVQREFLGNEVLPGGEYFWSFGAGLAVSPRVTLSSRFIAAYVSETQVNGDRIPGSIQEPMSIRLAATIAQKGYFVEPFVDFGTTNDADSTTFGVIWTY